MKNRLSNYNASVFSDQKHSGCDWIGLLPQKETWFNPIQNCESVVTHWYPQAKAKHLSLVSVVAQDVPADLWGEQSSFCQIISSLIENAITFTREGGIIVRLKMDFEEGIIVQVEDTGVGMSAGTQEHVHELLLPSARLTVPRQSGLAKIGAMVERMHGGIHIRSKLNKGSCLSIALPLMPGKICLPAESVLPRTALLFSRDDVLANALAEQLDRWGVNLGVITRMDGLYSLPSGVHPMLFDETILSDADNGDFKQYWADPRIADNCILLGNGNPYFSSVSGVGIPSLAKPIKSTHLFEFLCDFQKREIQSHAVPAKIERGLKVLLVESSAANRAVFGALLHGGPYVISLADTPAKAVEKSHQEHFDLIVMEFKSPAKVELNAAYLIRQQELNPDTPIVAIFDRMTDEDRRRCSAAGIDDYLRKPLNVDKLFQCLRLWQTCLGH